MGYLWSTPLKSNPALHAASSIPFFIEGLLMGKLAFIEQGRSWIMCRIIYSNSFH